jgi:hypothetical protein
MPRLTKTEAKEIARAAGIAPLFVNFHTLNSVQVESLIAAADARGYRKPKNANGSRGRYFFEYLKRAAKRGE